MKKIRNKTKIATFALVLLMASILLTLYTPVKAQELQSSGSVPLPAGVTPDLSLDSVPYLSFRPNPVGVGQTILVNIWVQPPLHGSRYFTDFKVTITDPDGNADVKTMDSYHGDSTAWLEYVVDQVGTWKIKFEFPGGYFPAGIYYNPLNGRNYTFAESVYYKPSSTAEQELVVQEEMVLSWPPAPLPTDYWTRPIPIENREWWEIGGHFPFTGRGGGPDWPADTNTYVTPDYDFIPYVQGPNTAHIAWKRQGALAGIIGGQFGQRSYGPGEGTYAGTPNIIFQGRCYDSFSKVVDGEATNVLQCFDLRTGEVYWDLIGVPTPSALVYNRLGPSAPGAGETGRGKGGSWGFVHLTYIGGGRMIKIDPWSGAIVRNVSIAPLSSGTVYMEPYVLSVQNVAGQRYLTNWTTTDYNEVGQRLTMAERVMSNVTWPWSNLGDSQDFEAGIAVDAYSISSPATGVSIESGIRAASLETGAELWDIVADVGFGTFSTSTGVADHGKFAVRFNDGFWRCYDLYSGNFLWKNEAEEWPWGSFGAYSVASAYGLIFDFSYAGVYALDWDDGTIAWHYHPGYPGYEAAFSSYPFFTNSYVADGKIYIGNGEHSPTEPLMRGWKLHCINATTGEGIWNITGGGSVGPIADGYLTYQSRYDGYMYVFGKGPSATTISAPQTVIPLGESIVLTGTVLDMSPGQPGTPCVSKDSMSGWMEYLHMQKPIPADVTGVPVSLDTLDPNGNYIHIGDVTTDMSGTFGHIWTPEVPGKYTVMATFLGDDSYGSSWAETHVGVGEASEPYPETPEYGSPEWPEYPEAPAYTTVDLVLIVVAIVTVCLVLYTLWTVRKRQ